MRLSRWIVAAVVAIAGASAGCSHNPDNDNGDDTPSPAFSNPPEIASANGVLETTLTIAPATVSVAGEDVTFPGLYNGLYMPPVLRVQPGDTINLAVSNFGVQSTNVHYHGLGVTPLDTGDNIFIEIESGITYQYDFRIPASHPQGLFWYHPHFDPLLNTQIAGGLSGGLIIGDILAPFPELRNIPERVMLLKDLKTEDGLAADDPDPDGPTTRTVNGLFQPLVMMQPGQLEFWRIGNIGSNIFYKLSLNGQPFYVLAKDGNLQNEVTATDTLLLPPGSRLEVLVYGPPAGDYRLETADFNTGPDGDAYPGQVLLNVASRGDAVDQIPLPTTFPPLRDLRSVSLTGRRTVVFADTDDPNVFTIDGKAYTPDCIDTLVTLGDVEEWTIQNTASEAHVFHIHQLDFQVTEIDGDPVPFTGYQDLITLPPAPDDDTPSAVKVIIPFTDPVIVGKFVYHCHIIQHEDQGMMANIFVQEPGGLPPDQPLCQP